MSLGWRIPVAVAVGSHIIVAMIPIGLTGSKTNENQSGKEGSLSITLASTFPTNHNSSMSPTPAKPAKKALRRTSVSKPNKSQRQSDRPAEQQSVLFDLSTYGRRVGRAIHQEKQYPKRAKKKKAEGTVILKVTLTRNGELQGTPIIKRSSKNQSLDEEAIRMVYSAAPFVPLPNEFTKESATLLIPIRFRINW